MPVGEPAGAVVTRRRADLGPSAVSVRHVSKAFALPRHRSWTLKERLRHPVASFGHDELAALTDVSFEVARGEFFAVIGRNGSGKSTLLRCIAGIHEPTAGEVEVRGRLAPFIELGVGFHPQLNAPDNVVVAGTLMGLRPAEARRRFPRVIGFAELEEFAEMPLANYSSGMQVRLAFSTSFQVDADVLLFDEVLAVGDAIFQRKCLATFDRLMAAGQTIVYVSHSLETIKRFADRVLLLDQGHPIVIGEPEAVIEEYERRNSDHQRRRAVALEAEGGEHVLVDTPFEDATERAQRHALEAADAESGLQSVRRFADVALTLARAEFKLRYLDSVVGYVWTLAQPLLMFAALYMIWQSRVLRFKGDHSNYPLKLLLAIALFTFFTEATGHALPSLVSKGSMLKKIPFPPLAVPLSSVLTSTFVYGFSLVIVIGFVLANGITPTLAWLELIPLVILLVTFTFGVSMVLSLLYVSIRDVQPIWVVVARLLFFLTPVFYPVEAAPGTLQHILMLNPLAVVIVQARHVLIDPASPTAAVAAGGRGLLALTLAFTAGLLAVGLWLYRTRARTLVERI